MKKLVCALVVLSFSVVAFAQTIPVLIPQPLQMTVVDSAYAPRTTKDIKIDPRADLPPEGYSLSISGKKIKIRAKTAQGLVWAQRTVEQLAHANGDLPEVEIKDYPAYAIRGFMHDTGRNFMEVEMIKHHLDILSFYKFNTFQWHLTDNPGWRIESKAYPILNDPKNHSRDFGKFYTYDQIREVIRYAKERGIVIIPEIDVPGHSAYFARAFGFKMEGAEGRVVLERCFKEFMREISPKDCPILHIGSDEVKIDDPKGFMAWAENLVRSGGFRTMVWDPGLPADSLSLRQVWNDSDQFTSSNRPGAFVDSYMGYLNYFDPIWFVNKMYLHKPAPKAQGGVLCLWNDTRAEDKAKIPVHSAMLPGMLAFSEVFWRNPDQRDFEKFERTMIDHRTRFLSQEAFYYVPQGHIPWTITYNDTVQLAVKGGSVNVDVLLLKNGIKPPRRATLEAKTSIFVARDTTILVWIGFETPARSNRMSGGIAPVGRWENEGNVLVNGVRIEPPLRREAGKYRYTFNTWHTPENELPYTDEQFYWMREPVAVPLLAGRNQILITAPKVFGGQRWNFAFIPVTPTDRVGEFAPASGIEFWN